MKNYLLLLFLLFSPLAFGSSAVNPANTGNLGGFQATDDVVYTPTVTGLGTLASSGLYWHREGQYMIITGKVTPGTPTAAALSISLPTGYSINTTVAAANSVNLGYAHGFIGNYFTSLGFTMWAFYDGSDATKIFFSYAGSAGAATKNNGNDLTSAGNAVTFSLRIPIQGWSAGGGAGGAGTASQVMLSGDNGYGSTNTKVNNFTTTTTTGTDLTGTLSATLGGKIVVNVAATYTCDVNFRSTSGGFGGISQEIASWSGTTDIYTLTPANGWLCANSAPSAGLMVHCSVTRYFPAATIIHAHGDASAVHGTNPTTANLTCTRVN